jgi:hypothetical protein
MIYESAMNSTRGDDVALAKSLSAKVQFWTGILCYNHTQSAAGSTLKQNSCKHFRCSMTQQPSHQICTTASRKIERHYGTSWEDSCSRDPKFLKRMIKNDQGTDQGSHSRTNSFALDTKETKDNWWIVSRTWRIHGVWWWSPQKSGWTKWSATRQQRNDLETSIPESAKHQQRGKSSARPEQ